MADYRLDEATRKSLLGLMPFTQGGTMDYTPECLADAPEAARATFKQRAFTRAEFTAVRNLYTDEKVVDKQTPLWEVVCKTIMGWDRVFDLATGEPIAYKADPNGGLDKDLWEGLPLIIRRELATNATVMSGLLQQERLALR